MHISTALYSVYAEKAPKHLWCKGVRARHVCSHWYIFIHSLLWDIGLQRMSGKFYPLNCSIRQKPSKINGTFLLWWMRKSVEAAHAAIPKEKCGDTNCAIILNWNVDLSLPIYHNWEYLKWLLDVNEHYLWQTTSSVEGHWFLPM